MISGSSSSSAARAARRAAIKAKIRKYQEQIKKCRSTIQKLIARKKNLRQETSEWDHKYRNAMNSHITAEIVVTNHYEGITAEKFREDFPAAQSKMIRSVQRTNEVQEDISAQVDKINQYIEKLCEKIDELRAKL